MLLTRQSLVRCRNKISTLALLDLDTGDTRRGVTPRVTTVFIQIVVLEHKHKVLRPIYFFLSALANMHVAHALPSAGEYKRQA